MVLNVDACKQQPYWLNLQNATSAGGDPVYWDENSGVGCGTAAAARHSPPTVP